MGVGGASKPRRKRSLANVRAINWLRLAYPKVFTQYSVEMVSGEDGSVEIRQYRLPLRLGAIREILANPSRPKSISTTAIRRAVAQWTLHGVYLASLAAPGAMRYRLDGTIDPALRPDGMIAAKVTSREARVAFSLMLARRGIGRPSGRHERILAAE